MADEVHPRTWREATEIYTLSLHDALPICASSSPQAAACSTHSPQWPGSATRPCGADRAPGLGRGRFSGLSSITWLVWR